MSSPLPRSGGGASTGRQAGAQRRGLTASRADIDGWPHLRGTGSQARSLRSLPEFANGEQDRKSPLFAVSMLALR